MGFRTLGACVCVGKKRVDVGVLITASSGEGPMLESSVGGVTLGSPPGLGRGLGKSAGFC
jgi:hypothetical protein